MDLLKIGNYTPPCPSDYVGTTSTIVDNGRNVNGVVVGAVVREDVPAVDVTYNYITCEDWSNILKQFSSNFGGRFYQTVTFFDQLSNSKVTRVMYVADRVTGGLHMLNENGKPQGWKDAKLSLVGK